MKKPEDRIERIDGKVILTLDGVTKPISEWKTPLISYDQLRSRAWRYLNHKANGKTPTHTVREIVNNAMLTTGGRKKKEIVVEPLKKVYTGVSGLFCALTLGNELSEVQE